MSLNLQRVAAFLIEGSVSTAAEQLEIEMLLRFRADHRAQRRPAGALESDMAPLEARLDALRERRLNFLYE